MQRRSRSDMVFTVTRSCRSLHCMSIHEAQGAPPAVNLSRFQSLAPLVVFDTVGPTVAYLGLLSAGLSTLAALVLSGVLPAFGVALTVALRRRLDAIGALVLIGIIVGAVAGLASGSAHLVLIDGVIPTAVFGAVCLASLWSHRPMMYRFALEFIGADTAKGRDFADRWRHQGFRHAFGVTTVVWGVAFIVEAAVQVIIVESSSAGTAKVTAQLLPLVFAAPLIAWNVSYAKRGRRQGELADAARRARGETPPAMPS